MSEQSVPSGYVAKVNYSPLPFAKLISAPIVLKYMITVLGSSSINLQADGEKGGHYTKEVSCSSFFSFSGFYIFLPRTKSCHAYMSHHPEVD
jgi:hypothetical protein